jgi:TolB-like protein
MKILSTPRAALLALACLLLFPSFAFAGPRVAVLELENRAGDPRYDYLGGIVQGLLLYDLSSSGALELLDRGSIAALLEERELSLSSIAAAQARAFEGISTADYIVAGEYVLLGAELRLTFKLVDVATSRVATFSDSGSTENLVHGLAEALVERLTGKRPALREEGRSRSLLSLRDETPGSISLFSPLIDAQVLLDGEFVGYTIGDRRVPFIIEGLDPGEHVLSTDLGADFGVIGLPAVTFAPWKETVRVVSGKRAIVTDRSAHFNEGLYPLRYVLRESPKVSFDAAGLYAVTLPFSFQDRTGTARKGRLLLSLKAPSGEQGQGSGTAICEFEGQTRVEQLEYTLETDAETEFVIGLALFSISVENSYGRVDLDLSVERTDVYQGLHRDEQE